MHQGVFTGQTGSSAKITATLWVDSRTLLRLLWANSLMHAGAELIRNQPIQDYQRMYYICSSVASVKKKGIRFQWSVLNIRQERNESVWFQWWEECYKDLPITFHCLVFLAKNHLSPRFFATIPAYDLAPGLLPAVRSALKSIRAVTWITFSRPPAFLRHSTNSLCLYTVWFPHRTLTRHLWIVVHFGTCVRYVQRGYVLKEF